VLGTSLAGQWALVGRVMNAPTSLATGPFTNSFIAESSDLIRTRQHGRLRSALGRWRVSLFAYGLLASTLTACVVLILPVALGSEWSRMRILIPLGFVYAVSQCAVGPTGQMLNLIAKSDVQLKWDLARAASIGIAFGVLVRGLPVLTAYAVVMAAFYAFLHLITSRQVETFAKKAVAETDDSDAAILTQTVLGNLEAEVAQ
jgi:O-antigen/teichoic acid export membrane protein